MANSELSTINPDLTRIKSQNLDVVSSGPNTFQLKGRSIYFWTKTVQSSSITVPPLAGEDIKLLALSLLFLERQNPDSTLFSLPVSHFPSCQALVTWKQKAGTRWKTHKSTYANPSLSQWLQALSSFKALMHHIQNSYLDTHGFNPCVVLAATTIRHSTGCKVPQLQSRGIDSWMPHLPHLVYLR